MQMAAYPLLHCSAWRWTLPAACHLIQPTASRTGPHAGFGDHPDSQRRSISVQPLIDVRWALLLLRVSCRCSVRPASRPPPLRHKPTVAYPCIPRHSQSCLRHAAAVLAAHGQLPMLAPSRSTMSIRCRSGNAPNDTTSPHADQRPSSQSGWLDAGADVPRPNTSTVALPRKGVDTADRACCADLG